MNERKVPLRKCLGCGEMKEKKQLLRVVKSKTGDITVDLLGKAAGRGAYICRSVSCFDAAYKSHRLEKAFSGQIPASVYDSLRKQVEESNSTSQS